MRKSLISIGAIGILFLSSGCALAGDAPSPAGAADPAVTSAGALDGVDLTVASKNFTEQLLLCEITALRLESEGAAVERTCGMAGSSAVREALQSGAVDMYWEYTGSGWLIHLAQTEIITDPALQYEKLRALDQSTNNVMWLPTSPANNTYAIAVKTETAQELGVSTISDYAALVASDPAQATFCGASEFFGRDDGWPGLKAAYGIDIDPAHVAELAEGPIYNAIAEANPCTFGEAFATDGRIAALGLTVLDDDKAYFPPYNLSLNVGGEVLTAHPEIETVMNPVRALLTTEELQNLNAQIDVDGMTPEAVASEWLATNGLK